MGDYDIIILVLLAVTVIISLISLIDSSAANHTLTNINNTISSKISTALEPVVAKINDSVTNTIQIDGVMESQINNLSIQITNTNGSTDNKILGVNSQLSANTSQIETNISLVSTEVSNLPGILNITINKTLSRNNSFFKRKITINMSNYTIPSNGYYYGTILQGFANHINFTSNQSVVLNILTYKQFANFASGNTFSNVNEYNGKNESIWVNESEGCNAYVFTITGSTSPFTVKMNQTAIYSPSSSATGVC